MKINKVLICLIISVILIATVTSVQAGLIDNIFTQGNGFFNGKTDQGGIGGTISKYIMENILPLINTIGNLIIYTAIVVIGVKYIWSGVDEKAEIKESLPNICVAMVVYFGAITIFDFFKAAVDTVTSGDTIQSAVGTIWGSISLIVRILAFSGVLAVGLKYMLTSSDGRADIKKSLLPVTIGIVMVFVATGVVDFVMSILNSVT